MRVLECMGATSPVVRCFAPGGPGGPAGYPLPSHAPLHAQSDVHQSCTGVWRVSNQITHAWHGCVALGVDMRLVRSVDVQRRLCAVRASLDVKLRSKSEIPQCF